MANDPARILVVDDEPAIRSSLVTVLEKQGFKCHAAGTGEEAIEAFDADPFDIVITDIRMPGKSGVDVMRHVKAATPDTIVLLITAHASLDTAVAAVREGASDYLNKPIRFEHLILRIRSLLRMRDLEWENRILRIEKRSAASFGDILGESESIREVKQSVVAILEEEVFWLMTKSTFWRLKWAERVLDEGQLCQCRPAAIC